MIQATSVQIIEYRGQQVIIDLFQALSATQSDYYPMPLR
ncbi:hypothetical protein JCM19236_1156 [Vibrio sp. JCM 19236]|nr:hypothetical protein JCM19236_1156 [Vibrio sp. JCM 19236]